MACSFICYAQANTLHKQWSGTALVIDSPIITLYNLVVSFLLTAGHDTDGCRINTKLQLDEGKKIIFFKHLE